MKANIDLQPWQPHCAKWPAVFVIFKLKTIAFFKCSSIRTLASQTKINVFFIGQCLFVKSFSSLKVYLRWVLWMRAQKAHRMSLVVCELLGGNWKTAIAANIWFKKSSNNQASHSNELNQPPRTKTHYDRYFKSSCCWFLLTLIHNITWCKPTLHLYHFRKEKQVWPQMTPYYVLLMISFWGGNTCTGCVINDGGKERRSHSFGTDGTCLRLSGGFYLQSAPY